MEYPHDFEPSADALPVRLDHFEGPLDLLVYLIKKHEVNIYDIPIVLITAQYLETIELMEELDLDFAGEFLVMAATLIHIKSKMLLPRPDTAAGVEGEDEGDPRDALVRRLVEHEKFKAAAGLLHEREQIRSAQWARPDERVVDIAGDAYEPELEVDLFSLLAAFQAVLRRANRPKLPLPSEHLSVEQRMSQILERLSETEACAFEELFADVHDRDGVIVTFLALLEMIRLELVRVFQSGTFAPIRVYKRPRPAGAPHPIGDPEVQRG
jgi:segregation and condensation protein A